VLAWRTRTWRDPHVSRVLLGATGLIPRGDADPGVKAQGQGRGPVRHGRRPLGTQLAMRRLSVQVLWSQRGRPAAATGTDGFRGN